MAIELTPLGEALGQIFGSFLSKGLETVFPQITEVAKVAKKVGYESPANEEVAERVETHISETQARQASYIGAALGAPLGLFPFMMDYYSSGVGGFVKQEAAYAFRPYLLTPDIMIELARRKLLAEPTETFDAWDDLRRQGWSDERIEALKELIFVMPTPSDLVTWMAREVFEPDSIEKYGLLEEFEKVKTELFEKVGVSEEMAKNYWMAHWVHTSFTQMIELLHRGLLTGEKGVPTEPKTRAEWAARDKKGIEELYDWYRLVEVTPFWRDLLTEATWNVPTRVDVRRWWDMATIDEAELYSIYHRQGYHNKDLDNYVTWTKVYTDLPDLIARYKNGWITLNEVLGTLITDGMPEERALVLLETKIKKPYQAERVAKERDLTKSEIIKGVKKKVISVEQGIAWLMEMGYDRDEADFIVAVNVATEGSPETPLEYRGLVEAYRKSQGMEAKEIPQEVVEAERLAKDLTAKLQKAIEEKQPQETIDYLTVDKTEAMVRLRELLVLYGLQ